jgi:hypothetical protein
MSAEGGSQEDATSEGDMVKVKWVKQVLEILVSKRAGDAGITSRNILQRGIPGLCNRYGVLPIHR